MTNVGFCGGNEIRELGPASDMKIFFWCLNLAFETAPTLQSDLITDRLYRRYLRLDELDLVKDLSEKARQTLRKVSTNAIPWKEIGLDSAVTRLDTSNQNPSEIFEKYFQGLHRVIGNAAGYQKRFGEYRRVMTIISDLPRFHIDEMRPLAEYDALEGEPIWLRH